jgi:hypothetical protein
MRADMQGFCKFKVASRIDIFILQKTKKHISLKNVSADSVSLAALRKLAKRYQ